MSDTDTSLLNFDHAHLWHPYARMYTTTPAYPIISAEGVYLRLSNGKQLIDGMSSWWAAIHGYRHPILDKALRDQAEQMSHVMFGGLTHKPAVHLGRHLLDILPDNLNAIFFSDSGSVAVEVAIKIAFQYWLAKNMPRRHRLLTIRHGYHGDTFGAMSVCDPVQGMHHLFSPLLPQQIFAEAPACGETLDQNAVDHLAAQLEKHHQDIAAVILEPIVQGAGGMRVYAAEYLRHVRRLCDEYEVLLIFDEIATGFGRTGRMFAAQHAQVVPDIICIGKAMSAGYLSLAATVSDERIAAVINDGDPGVLMHGPTYMANPLACAVAAANLRLLSSGEWQQQVQMIETQLQQELAPCLRLPQVKRVSVKGAIGAVEMKHPVDVPALCQQFVKQGVWLRPFANLIYLMPPYIIQANELTRLTTAIVKACRD